MKNTIIILSVMLITLSLISFGYNNWKPKTECQPIVKEAINNANVHDVKTEFIYDVSTRYIAKISRSDLHNARSVKDIFPKKATIGIEEFSDSKTSLMQGEKEITISWLDGVLNPSQLDLFSKAEFSDNIYVSAYYNTNNQFSGAIEQRRLTYFLSVVPQQEAKYKLGQEALLAELSTSTEQERNDISMHQIRPGRILFTIDKTGKIKNVKLSSTCGFDLMDEALTKKVTSLQADWIPAKNARGEFVDQELVLFFGTAGC